MQVVVIRSPKALCGILRKLCGIRNEIGIHKRPVCGIAAAHRPFTAGIPPPAAAYTLTETDRERSTLHMELKIFRDTLPQGGAGCTVKAELPLETDIRISDDLPPVGKLV